MTLSNQVRYKINLQIQYRGNDPYVMYVVNSGSGCTRICKRLVVVRQIYDVFLSQETTPFSFFGVLRRAFDRLQVTKVN